jgi:hypothetical protein
MDKNKTMLIRKTAAAPQPDACLTHSPCSLHVVCCKKETKCMGSRSMNNEEQIADWQLAGELP